MNQSVDRSLILPDEYKEIVSPMQRRIDRIKRLFIIFTILAILFLTLTIYLVASHGSFDDLKQQNGSLENTNSQLRSKNAQLKQDLSRKNEAYSKLLQQYQADEKTLQNNNDLIAYLQNDIKLNCNITQHRLRLNMTSMSDFSLSQQNSAQDNDIAPAITFLNLSGNQLTKFTDNVIPYLEYLDLSGNNITNMANNQLNSLDQLDGLSIMPSLQQFTSNQLPSIKSLNLSGSALTIFQKNILSSLQVLDLSNNQIKSFSNQTLANLKSLNVSGNPITTFSNNKFEEVVGFSLSIPCNDQKVIIQFKDNYFGKLDSFSLGLVSQQIRCKVDFSGSYFPYLSAFTFSRITFNYGTFLTKAKVPTLTNLTFNYCDLIAFQNTTYTNLESLQLENTKIPKFSSYQYPKLKSLVLVGAEIEEFTNNNLPLLQKLVIGNYFTGFKTFSNNTMPKLKKVTLWGISVKDLSWLNSQSIQDLQVTYCGLKSFSNYICPRLHTLILNEDDSIQFLNNSLPALKTLSIRTDNIQILRTPLIDQLQIFQVSGSFKSFTNFNLPNLKLLSLKFQNQNPNIFTNNSFPTVQTIQIGYVNSVSGNNLQSLRHLKIVRCVDFDLQPNEYCNLETLQMYLGSFPTFSHLHMSNLKNLVLYNVKTKEFLNNTLPQVTSIQASSNSLTTFDCRGMNKLERLVLYNNQLSDKIVDALINCKMNSLLYLNLRQNRIVNITRAISLLSNQYPRASINL